MNDEYFDFEDNNGKTLRAEFDGEDLHAFEDGKKIATLELREFDRDEHPPTECGIHQIHVHDQKNYRRGIGLALYRIASESRGQLHVIDQNPNSANKPTTEGMRLLEKAIKLGYVMPLNSMNVED